MSQMHFTDKCGNIYKKNRLFQQYELYCQEELLKKTCSQNSRHTKYKYKLADQQKMLRQDNEGFGCKEAVVEAVVEGKPVPGAFKW